MRGSNLQGWLAAPRLCDPGPEGSENFGTHLHAAARNRPARLVQHLGGSPGPILLHVTLGYKLDLCRKFRLSGET